MTTISSPAKKLYAVELQQIYTMTVDIRATSSSEALEIARTKYEDKVPKIREINSSWEPLDGICINDIGPYDANGDIDWQDGGRCR